MCRLNSSKNVICGPERCRFYFVWIRKGRLTRGVAEHGHSFKEQPRQVYSCWVVLANTVRVFGTHTYTRNRKLKNTHTQRLETHRKRSRSAGDIRACAVAIGPPVRTRTSLGVTRLLAGRLSVLARAGLLAL